MNNQTIESNKRVTQLYYVAFNQHPSEWPIVEALFTSLEHLEPKALIEAYTKLAEEFKNGNPSQKALYIFALSHTLKRVFGKSPIRLVENSRLVFGEAIVYDNGTYREVDEKLQVKLNDQSNLSSFVQQLNSGKAFDELDEKTKSWWRNRY